MSYLPNNSADRPTENVITRVGLEMLNTTTYLSNKTKRVFIKNDPLSSS